MPFVLHCLAIPDDATRVHQMSTPRRTIETIVASERLDVDQLFLDVTIKAALRIESENPALFERFKDRLHKERRWSSFNKVMTRARPASRISAAAPPPTYVQTPTAMFWNRPGTAGTTRVPLANFRAKIVADVTEDDGAETRRLFDIDVSQGDRCERVTVTAEEFAGMAWPIRLLGAQAIVAADPGVRDHLRAAIQTLSGSVPQQYVFAHTGWVYLSDGRWVYLHAGGGIDADGGRDDVSVRLGTKLSRFELPRPTDETSLIAAVKSSFALRLVAPFSVTLPLLGAIYVAPLREALGAYPPDFCLWLHGPSGVQKSELAALAQGHFGDFTRTTLPASFSATANANEKLLFTPKDALLVVDDYHPAQDPAEAKALEQLAARLLRGVGNVAGRARMRADTTLRGDYPPRALALVTGERLPRGHSNSARCFPIAIEPGGVRLSRLTVAQERRGELLIAMSGFIQWLAERFEDLRVELPSRFVALRDEVQSIGGHAREPGQVAHLLLGLETFCRFALEIGAASDSFVSGLLARARAELLSAASEHGAAIEAEKPEQRFLSLLRTGFTSGRAFVEAIDGGAPELATGWGWELRTPPGYVDAELRPVPGAARLGWIDSHHLFLIPEAAYGLVRQLAHEVGEVFGVDQRTISRRLDEAGAIEVVFEVGASGQRERRRTVRERVGADGIQRRVLKLRREALEEPETDSGDPAETA